MKNNLGISGNFLEWAFREVTISPNQTSITYSEVFIRDSSCTMTGRVHWKISSWRCSLFSSYQSCTAWCWSRILRSFQIRLSTALFFSTCRTTERRCGLRFGKTQAHKMIPLLNINKCKQLNSRPIDLTLAQGRINPYLFYSRPQFYDITSDNFIQTRMLDQVRDLRLRRSVDG